MSKRVSQFGKFSQIMYLVDMISTDIEELQWKNENNYGFDVAYLKETLQTMEKEQHARQQAIESQLSQLRIKKEAIRQATQQIHQGIQFKKQQCLTTVRTQFKKCQQDTNISEGKLQKTIKHTFDRINTAIDDVATKQAQQNSIWHHHLEEQTKDIRERTAEIQGALRQHSLAYQQSCQLLLDMVQKMYERHHSAIVGLKYKRQEQREKVYDLTELLIKQLKKLCF